MENEVRALSWDEEISQESEFTLLPEGEYDFTVLNFERGQFNGSDKIPPCNKAIITIGIPFQDKTVEIKENFFLVTKSEWLLSAFFIAIGQKKKGEPTKMNWNQVIGSTGRCKVGTREYNGNTYNQVKKWLEPAEQTPQQGGWAPGAW